MTTPTIAIIGAGNMGTSLIGGLIMDGHPSHKIWATDPSTEKLATLEKTFHIHTTDNNEQAIAEADVVIFAVKPQVFSTVATPLQKAVQTRKPLVISIAAGVREVSIQTWLGGNIAIVRAMPNTPALLKCGATGLYANPLVTHEQHNIAESVLRAVGTVVWLSEEHLLDAVTALSGCGPAYFFLMMDALQTAAQELGLPPEVARLLTLQTALGSARMAIESGTPLSELIRQVTSPGGSTEQALLSLEKNDLRGAFKKALMAAKNRAEELAGLI